jgi:hypothetical protein
MIPVGHIYVYENGSWKCRIILVCSSSGQFYYSPSSGHHTYAAAGSIDIRVAILLPFQAIDSPGGWIFAPRGVCLAGYSSNNIE